MTFPPRHLGPSSRSSARDAPRGIPMPLTGATGQRPSRAELPGSAQRLTWVSHAVAAVQWLALAVVAVLAALVGVGDGAVADALTVGAIAALLLLMAVGTVFVDSRRRLALDVIVEGQEALTVRVVVREQERLADVKTRARLAKTYECLFEEGLGVRRRPLRALPMVRPSVGAAVLSELGSVAALLRSERPGLDGVASAERLLIDGASPLYGEDVAALRDELERACSLLRL